jgi:hypothetical protein
MLDWDDNSKIIVFCSNKRGRTCYGGSYIIPDKNSVHEVEREMRIKDVVFDSKWIIVRTVQSKNNREFYYIIDKNYPLDGQTKSDDVLSYLRGPLEYDSFLKEVEAKKIKLRFKDDSDQIQ